MLPARPGRRETGTHGRSSDWTTWPCRAAARSAACRRPGLVALLLRLHTQLLAWDAEYRVEVLKEKFGAAHAHISILIANGAVSHHRRQRRDTNERRLQGPQGVSAAVRQVRAQRPSPIRALRSFAARLYVSSGTALVCEAKNLRCPASTTDTMPPTPARPLADTKFGAVPYDGRRHCPEHPERAQP